MSKLSRLLSSKSIVVIGGGAWCEAVLEQCQKIGFSGDLFAVHPKRKDVAGVPAFASLSDLPIVPDAAFVGVNRDITIQIVGELSAMGAGGAVCFASGFQESGDDGLNEALLAAAGKMPILGPNCYGFLNYLDRTALWPDQHGGVPVESGVAILTQSSNMAINLTMQARGLPLAFIVTAGNQAQQSIAEIGAEILADPRVTALGLHIEGFGDIRAFEALAQTARQLGKPIVAIKVGASEAARAATISHTASLAGSDAGADALLVRLGIARVNSLPVFLETLKVYHVHGRLPGKAIASLSCSGGEASLMADTALSAGVEFPALTTPQAKSLKDLLGPLVNVVNPLDYHTFIWRDRAAMAEVFALMTGDAIDLTVIVIDFPRGDRCSLLDWEIAIGAIEDAARASGGRFAIVASLPEALPEEIAIRFMASGILPLYGIEEGLQAIAAASKSAPEPSAPVLLAKGADAAVMVNEGTAKAILSTYGVPTPQGARAESAAEIAEASKALTFPVVLKGEGLAHKSEAGAVVLGLTSASEVKAAADRIGSDGYLVEEMVSGVVAELLFGVARDPAHGFVLTIAAGGVLGEILRDSQSLLLPTTPSAVREALGKLALSRILAGYRGKPAADVEALVEVAMALQAYVIAKPDGLEEVEMNPVMALPHGAVAVDALIRRGEST